MPNLNDIVYQDSEYPDEEGSYVLPPSHLSTTPPAVHYRQAPVRMSEAELRIAKATYIRMLINEPIFDGGADPIAAEVQNEIQSWANKRLNELLGIQSPKAPGPELTNEEILILKGFVETIKARRASENQPKVLKLDPPQYQVVQPVARNQEVTPPSPPPLPEAPPAGPPKIRKRRTSKVQQLESKPAPRATTKGKTTLLPNGQSRPNLEGNNVQIHPAMTPDMQTMGMAGHARPVIKTTQETVTSRD